MPEVADLQDQGGEEVGEGAGGVGEKPVEGEGEEEDEGVTQEEVVQVETEEELSSQQVEDVEKEAEAAKDAVEKILEEAEGSKAKEDTVNGDVPDADRTESEEKPRKSENK